MKLILVRHGETASNKDHVIQGQIDTDLNATGETQATEAGKELYGTKFNAIYCSDLKRAKDTSTLLLDAAGSDVVAITTAKLREMHYGSLQGESKDSFNWEGKDSAEKIGGGESAKDVYERVQKLINKLNEHFKGNETVLIISHRGPLAALLHMSSGQGSYTSSVPNAEPIFIEITQKLKIPAKIL